MTAMNTGARATLAVFFACLLMLLPGPTVVAPAAGTGEYPFTIQQTLDGAAGDWVLIYERYPTPVPNPVFYQFTWNLTIQPSGSNPTGLISTLPSPVFRDPSISNVQRVASDIVASTAYGDLGYLLSTIRLQNKEEIAPFSEHGTMRFRADDGTAYGFQGAAYLVGSTAPWHLAYTIQVSDSFSDLSDPTAIVGPITNVTYLYQGHGLSMSTFTERTTVSGAPFGYTAGSLNGTLSSPSPGWTHIQYDWTNHLDDFKNQAPTPISASRERVGFHDYQISLPNGFQYVSPSLVVEAPPDIQPYPLRSLGAMEDAAGTVRANILRYDNSTDVSLTIAHLPMESGSFPPDIQRWNYTCRYHDLHFRYRLYTDNCFEGQVDSLSLYPWVLE